MFKLNKIIYQNSKVKYYSVIIIQLIISLLNTILVNSFFDEITEITLFYLFILFGVLQTVNIIGFILFKAIYNKELFKLEDEYINIFQMTEKAYKKNIISKTIQNIIFFAYQFIFLLVINILFFSLNYRVITLIINFIFSLIIFLCLYSIIVAVNNNYSKGYIYGRESKMILLSIVGFLYYPSFSLLGIATGGFIGKGINSYVLIMRGIKLND